jgi:hypothetical protein
MFDNHLLEPMQRDLLKNTWMGERYNFSLSSRFLSLLSAPAPPPPPRPAALEEEEEEEDEGRRRRRIICIHPTCT